MGTTFLTPHKKSTQHVVQSRLLKAVECGVACHLHSISDRFKKVLEPLNRGKLVLLLTLRRQSEIAMTVGSKKTNETQRTNLHELLKSVSRSLLDLVQL